MQQKARMQAQYEYIAFTRLQAIRLRSCCEWDRRLLALVLQVADKGISNINGESDIEKSDVDHSFNFKSSMNQQIVNMSRVEVSQISQFTYLEIKNSLTQSAIPENRSGGTKQIEMLQDANHRI